MPKPKIDITEAVVHSRKQLPFGSGAHVDKNLPGFMVLCGRVSRTYAYQREVNGKTMRVNLGHVGEITADNARLEALKAKKAIDAGQNPNLTPTHIGSRSFTGLPGALSRIFLASSSSVSALLSPFRPLF